MTQQLLTLSEITLAKSWEIKSYLDKNRPNNGKNIDFWFGILKDILKVIENYNNNGHGGFVFNDQALYDMLKAFVISEETYHDHLINCNGGFDIIINKDKACEILVKLVFQEYFKDKGGEQRW